MTTFSKFLRSFFPFLVLSLLVMFFSTLGFADDIQPQDFLSQVFSTIKGMGGMSFLLKTSAVIGLLISSMKVSFLRSLLWDKLGDYKALAAPALGLVAGLLTVISAGPVTLAGLVAYIFAGAGAIALHEVLDACKAIPGIGPKYSKLIDVISSVLGGQQPAPQKSA